MRPMLLKADLEEMVETRIVKTSWDSMDNIGNCDLCFVQPISWSRLFDVASLNFVSKYEVSSLDCEEVAGPRLELVELLRNALLA